MTMTLTRPAPLSANATWRPATVDFEVFALFLEARRIHRGRKRHQVARAAGVTLDEVNRAAAGRDPGAAAFFALCDWMGEPSATFLRRDWRARGRRLAHG